METKKCSHCKIDKNVSEFNKRKLSKDGLQSRCRDCMCDYLKSDYKFGRKII